MVQEVVSALIATKSAGDAHRAMRPRHSGFVLDAWGCEDEEGEGGQVRIIYGMTSTYRSDSGVSAAFGKPGSSGPGFPTFN